jgi:hypothetical protein
VTGAAPLSGIRVLDLTRYLAGPFCTMLLADYGADVVKVESPKGREFRLPGMKSDTYFFLSSNRGKRSLTLDLGSAAGRELLLRLIGRFDVLVENFRPGVMEQLGLGPKLLSERFPQLIYCGISGFGADGPYADRPGFDQIAQGMSPTAFSLRCSRASAAGTGRWSTRRCSKPWSPSSPGARACISSRVTCLVPPASTTRSRLPTDASERATAT